MMETIRQTIEYCYIAIGVGYDLKYSMTVAYPGIFFGGGGGSTNSVEDRG